MDLSQLQTGAELQAPPRYFTADKLLNYRIVDDMPNDIYHSDENSISSSALKHATTPIMYKQYLKEGFNLKNNTCLLVGTALHSLLLEKTKQHEFMVYDEQKLLNQVQELRPDTSVENLKRTKEWKEVVSKYKDDNGMFLDGVLEKKQFDSIWNVQKKLRKHPELTNLYHNAMPEVSIFASFEEVNVRIRPDLIKVADQQDFETFGDINVGDIIIMSVKTTIDASPNGFAREARKLNYALAEAFYTDVAKVVYGKNVHVFYLAVEKDTKHVLTGQAMLYRCTNNHIARGREEYEANLSVAIFCNENPTEDQGYEFHNNGSIISQID